MKDGYWQLNRTIALKDKPVALSISLSSENATASAPSDNGLLTIIVVVVVVVVVLVVSLLLLKRRRPKVKRLSATRPVTPLTFTF